MTSAQAITPQFLQPYFDGKRRHSAYHDSVELYHALRVHANGEFPVSLIRERRPSETDDILSYREKIFEPVTKDCFKRIITSLNKIRRSSDWSIQYNAAHFPKGLPADDMPDKYTEENFPFHTSVTNWIFTILLKNYLIDPNAVILVKPISTDVEASEYLQPFPLLFNSDQVLEYIDGELAILKSDEKVEYKYGNGTKFSGEIYYVVTKEVIQRWEQQNAKREFALADEYFHGLGTMPAFRLWAEFYEQYDTSWISESRISSIVPRLNEVVREYSDLQAGVVNHLYPEAWEWASQPCDRCCDESGTATGKVKQGKQFVTCPRCKGMLTTGTAGPYKKMVVRPSSQNMGEQAVPIPPKGYIGKDVEIIKIQDERIDKHQYAALASINMQFLLEVPSNQSGYAKEVDKEELNHFVYSIAEDIVGIMDKLYKLIIEYRYRLVVPNAADRALMLPKIAVPEKFDILSLTVLLDEITKAVTAKMNPVIIATMLKEYVAKKFYSHPEVRDVLTCILDLDPLACISEDEKVQRKQNGGITDLDYIISSNILRFVQQAISETPGFVSLKLVEKRAVMLKFAEGVKGEMGLK